MKQETKHDVLGVVNIKGTGNFRIRGIGNKYEHTWKYIYSLPEHCCTNSWMDFPWSGFTLEPELASVFLEFMQTTFPNDLMFEDEEGNSYQ